MLYKAGYHRIQSAIKAELYLEAIALVESLISDRLESRLGYLTASDIAFQNLGKLIYLMRVRETQDETKTFVAVKVDLWLRARNAVAHEMLTIQIGDDRSWEVRQAELKGIAIEGYHDLKPSLACSIGDGFGAGLANKACC